MIGLKLRDEFLSTQMPGTAITLRTNDNKGAIQKSPQDILSITYPTTDVQTALRAISDKRAGRPIVLIGERGRGKSHIMAVMHHAAQSPDIVENWIKSWGNKMKSDEMKQFSMQKGFIAISEPVHNHEYPLLWDLIFDRHPKGQYYRGKFETMNQSYPPRSLMESMFQDNPTVLILDELQTWFNGLPEEDPKTKYRLKDWAFNFIQNLSEIAKDRPDILIFVISVLDNQNEAFKQVHRNSPIIIDFSGPTAKQDRQRLLLHRLFENRDNIAERDIQNLSSTYADERYRLAFPNSSPSERDRIRQDVFDCWPFSPELIELLEDHILLSQAAQETRDMIRILAQVFKSRGEESPIITASDFLVDSDSDEVQSLVDSIATQVGQEKLRQIAQRNLEAVIDAGVPVPHARELISAIWMRSMSPAKIAGGTPTVLHLDITKNTVIDDNLFQAELSLLIDNSINIHGDEVQGGRLWFGVNENPKSKVRANAKNSKLWQVGAVVPGGQTAYPGKDIEHIKNTLRHILVTEMSNNPSKVIILGPKWESSPWDEVDENEKPDKWQGPILVIIPEQIERSTLNYRLGSWLAKHVSKRRNTVRFLLLSEGMNGLFDDENLIYFSRCSFLCSKNSWGIDSVYYNLMKDFDTPLRNELKKRFNRFAILNKWDFQNPSNCGFDVEKVSAQGSELSSKVEEKITTDLFDPEEFRRYIIDCAKNSDFISSILDELSEPPAPGSNIPLITYLGDMKLYEKILEIAALGDIALNIKGSWVVRRSEDIEYDVALRFIKSKAYCIGQEMRQVQISLPGAVGGGGIVGTQKPQPKPQQNTSTATNPQTEIGATGSTSTEPGGNVHSGYSGEGEITNQPKVLEVKTHRVSKKTEEPATSLNLTGYFEKWGIEPIKTIESVKIEFSGLTVQQIKQILMKIPSSFKASLEIEYNEEEKE